MNAKATKESGANNAELIEKIKADDAAKKAAAQAEKDAIAAQEKAEAERIAAEQAKDNPPDPERTPEQQATIEAAAAAIAAAERDEKDVPVFDASSQRKAAGMKAYDLIRRIAMSYPQSTPDDHTIFGFAGVRYTLGDLRDLTNIR